MKYLKVFGLAFIICFVLYTVASLIGTDEEATVLATLATPFAIWSARLVVASRSGVITRRIPLIDGGAVFSGVFWSFNPDVYERGPGFDNFKGYLFGESVLCLLASAFVLAAPVVELLNLGPLL